MHNRPFTLPATLLLLLLPCVPAPASSRPAEPSQQPAPASTPPAPQQSPEPPAQQPETSPQPASSPPSVSSADSPAAQSPDASPHPSPLSPEQARYLQLATETANLNHLVLDLQSTLLKTDPNTLPLPVIKKAEEIQKLAATLKKQLRPTP